ncbi:MAG: glycosyltransferase [Planctomycetota bacterium]
MARRFSVFVVTYNAPDQLDLILCALNRQTRPAEEVWIADDGSTDETRALIESHKSGFASALEHAWQKDNGRRKARIVNEAVRRSSGEQLLFLDGDTIPHSCWVEDHAAAADDRRVLCGRRVKLGPEISKRIDREWVKAGRLEQLFGPVLASALRGDTQRMPLGLRLPRSLARLFHPRARRLMGVNYSLPRTVFERVNGYNEEINRREDFELECRLKRAKDIPFFPLLNRAVAYHLWHKPIETKPLADRWLHSDLVRCEKGLQTVVFDPDE